MEKWIKRKKNLKNDMWVNMETKKMHCARKNMLCVKSDCRRKQYGKISQIKQLDSSFIQG